MVNRTVIMPNYTDSTRLSLHARTEDQESIIPHLKVRDQSDVAIYGDAKDAKNLSSRGW